MSAEQNLEIQQILSLQKSQKSSRSGQFVKDFSANKFSLTDKSKSREEADSSSKIFQQQIRLFPFFTMTPNDRGYGLGRAAGGFPVATATKEMRNDLNQSENTQYEVVVLHKFFYL